MILIYTNTFIIYSLTIFPVLCPQMERQNVEDLQRALTGAKQRYKAALDSLEAISEEVHRKRKLDVELPPRTPGVGAESTSDQSDLPSINLGMSLKQFLWHIGAITN